MRYLLLTLFCLISLATLGGADPFYPAATIPEALKKDANAVIRNYSRTYELKSSSSAVDKHSMVITILNQNGKHFATEFVNYDLKLSKVNSIHAAIYDANGDLVKKIKSTEIRDVSAIGESTIQGSSRVKIIDLSYGSYPYTIEYEYEIVYNYLFDIDSYYPYPTEKVSIEKSNFTLSHPETLSIRYTTVKMGKENKSISKGLVTNQWVFNDKPCILYEPNAPVMKLERPYVLIAPEKFEFDGYSGEMSTWAGFGKWIGSLNSGRDVLNPATVTKVNQLVAGLTKPEDKAKVLYEYMQNRTRYISIQLGIGGFQPFEADYVDRLGYGDCKALSNYMISLLKAAGIKANYILIRAGDDATPINESFPSNQFNHAIACIPLPSDTIWLECTSQQSPFGYLGSFTSNRTALMITDNGAQLVKTPTYSSKNNIRSRNISATITPAGDAQVVVNTTYNGLRYDDSGLSFVLTSDPDTKRKWIERTVDIATYDILKFDFQNQKNIDPKAMVKLDLFVRKYASPSGKRFFIPVNLMSKSRYIPERTESRKSEIEIQYGTTDIDTVTFTFPMEMYPEHLPEGQKISTRFGVYETSYQIDQGKLIYIRKLEKFKGIFPASTYTEFVDFYKDLNKADNSKIVLLGKT